MINYTIFVGLDVHKDSITVAMARSVLLDKVNATGSMVKGCNKSYKRSGAFSCTKGMGIPTFPPWGEGCV